MYILGCETLGLESNAVVLSAGLLHFELGVDYTFNNLVESVRFVKFDVKEQVEKYKRSIEKGTVTYWKSLSKEAREHTCIPSDDDYFVSDGLFWLRELADEHPDDMVLSRGFLSKTWLESLCRSSNNSNLFKNNQYAETGTMINCIKDTGKNGFCVVDGFDKSVMNKNILEHRLAYDAYMLLNGL